MFGKKNPNSSNLSSVRLSDSKDKDFGEGFKSLIVFVLLALLLRGTVVEAFKIPSESMLPTLEVGDHILVNKLSYGLRLDILGLPWLFKESFIQYREPKRGDVVVFTLPDNPATPEDESNPNIIKRVIGLPGDKVEVRGTKVFINDIPLEESYPIWQGGGQKDFGPEVVPQGHIFMLGDNRDQSKDSRFWVMSHFLDIKRVKGRAFIIYLNSRLRFSRVLNVIR